MKKLIFIILFFSVLPVFSQWIQQSSGTTNSLPDIKFINSKTGWAVGVAGTILKTTNAGINWISQTNPIPQSTMFAVFPVDSEYVYAAGPYQKIIKTTNGGTNWFVLQDGPDSVIQYYYGIHFADRDRGWVCGDNGIFLTVSGGVAFDKVSNSGVYDIHFRDEFEGIACSGLGRVYRTTNAGIFWDTSRVQGSPPFGFSLKNFSFINSDTGFVGSYGGNTFITTNFGLTWDSIPKPPRSVSNIRFVNMNTGWIGGDGGYLYKTTNRGLNWLQENVSQFGSSAISSIDNYNDSILWLSGNGGKILYTTTAGTVGITNLNTTVNSFTLYQNYPNPFNPVTEIKFDLLKSGNVSLKVFDLIGKEVIVLINEKLSSGSYSYNFNASALSSGIYFYIIETAEFSQTKKMMLLK